nr:RNA-directed DNA polymerase, eukaryota, nucleotide-binding alpha-beta plait domain protein [Tanacetum cinerariifolium]
MTSRNKVTSRNRDTSNNWCCRRNRRSNKIEKPTKTDVTAGLGSPAEIVMGEDWQEVPSRNHRRSNADDVSKVAKSVYVTNFPESVSARDLWKSCSVYRTVVDVFIPSKKIR